MRILITDDTPTDWDSQKISFYVEEHKGGAPLKPSDFSATGFPVIPKKAIQASNELIIKKQTYCTDKFAAGNTRSVVNSSYTITTLRDLVPTGPTIGTVVNFNSDKQYILSQGVYGLKLRDNIDRNYFAYLSNTGPYRKIMRRVMVGSTQVHIRTPEYLNLEIQTPPLPEQQKIANILSVWDKAIRTIEKLIVTSKQQKKSLIQQLLTGKNRLVNPETGKTFEGKWELKKLKNLCDINPEKPSKPLDGIVSFIPMTNISEDGHIIHLEDKLYDDVSKGFTSFVDNDVIIAKITPCFENGKGAFISGLNNGIGFGSTEYHVLRAKNKTHPKFIYYLTRTSELLAKGEMNMQGSAGHRRVTADYFNAYKVNTPPYGEQQKIASVLTSADREIELLETKLEHFKQEKKALMQQLLTGKKRVKVDKLEVA
ncbi:restriction endonuclease subunit S [Psychromonas arctica]|uniref:restriction endonuclease subunit S n=1 Tax=Psychromonas arctica TaxID=168275 RepID=UPI0003FC95DB|nr:restriction endonuclease subunit S [Psychromonas arctica]